MEQSPQHNEGPPRRRFRFSPERGRLVPWLAVAGFALLLGTIYVVAAPESIDIAPSRISEPARHQTIDIGTTLSAHLGAPQLQGNQVDLLVNGDEIFPAMLDSIRGARESINLLTYVYWTGDVAETFANELAAAARRGVRVRVLLDAFGARKIDDAWIERMRKAGAHVAWYRPLHWNRLHHFNTRTHRKILVVDGRVGFTGGVGIAQEWTGNAQDGDHWRDNHFRVQGPSVRYLQGSFAENWQQATGTVLAGPAAFPEHEPKGNAEVVVVNAPAGERFDGIPLTYWILFRTARRSIQIATPYYVPDPDVSLGLRDAAERGVQVTLLVPGPHQDSVLVRYATRTYYRELLEAGVRIYEYQPTVMHTKLVMVDGTWALVGSPNFDSRSLELNDEIALAVRDPVLLADLAMSYAEDLRRSRPVDLEEAESRALWERVRDSAARSLREQL